MEKYQITATELANITGKTITGILKAVKNRSTKSGKRVMIDKSAVREILQKAGHRYDFIYSVQVNLRGASCKSSSTTIIASRLAALGYKTIVVDIDPQASSSLALGYISKDEDDVLVDVITDSKNTMTAIKQIEENLYLLPSNLGNTVLDSILGNSPVKQKTAMNTIVEELKRNGFEAILIDCPPSLGSAVISSLSSVAIQKGTLLIPTVSDVFSLKGIQLLTSEAKKLWESFGLATPEIKILFNKFDGREKISIEALRYLQQHNEYSKYLMPTIIKTCADIPKSQKFGETIFAMATKSSAKEDYDNVIFEITGLNNLKAQDRINGVVENVI